MELFLYSYFRLQVLVQLVTTLHQVRAGMASNPFRQQLVICCSESSPGALCWLTSTSMSGYVWVPPNPIEFDVLKFSTLNGVLNKTPRERAWKGISNSRMICNQVSGVLL
jgi:hypothetical protein